MTIRMSNFLIIQSRGHIFVPKKLSKAYGIHSNLGKNSRTRILSIINISTVNFAAVTMSNSFSTQTDFSVSLQTLASQTCSYSCLSLQEHQAAAVSKSVQTCLLDVFLRHQNFANQLLEKPCHVLRIQLDSSSTSALYRWLESQLAGLVTCCGLGKRMLQTANWFHNNSSTNRSDQY